MFSGAAWQSKHCRIEKKNKIQSSIHHSQSFALFDFHDFAKPRSSANQSSVTGPLLADTTPRLVEEPATNNRIASAS